MQWNANLKKKLINSYVLLILMIGLSSPILELAFKGYNNVFKQISPLPLLFSLGKGRLPKVHGAKIYLVTDKETHRFRFNKEFYSSLKGPHRRKVQFLVLLNGRKELMSKRSYNFLYEIFCQNYVNLPYLQGQKLKEVKAVSRTKTIVVECGK